MCGWRSVHCLIYFPRLHMGSFANIGLIRLLCWSLIVLFCCFLSLFCHVFLGLLLIYDLLCSGPWFGVIGSSWPILCHGWHWGVALYWCGEISFRYFYFIFSSSLGRNPFFLKRNMPLPHISFCLPFCSWLFALYPLFGVTNHSPCMVLLHSLLFWDILTIVLIY